jgi:hypothetical protein
MSLFIFYLNEFTEYIQKKGIRRPNVIVEMTSDEPLSIGECCY